MFYLRIDNIDYPATFTGKMQDTSWDNRATKTIHTSALPTDKQSVRDIIHDDVKWSIVDKIIVQEQATDKDGNPMYDEDGNPIMIDVEKETVYDNSEYSMVGDIIVHSNDSLSIVMGKPTDLEIAYELLYGGEE